MSINRIDEKIFFLEKEITDFYNKCLKNGATLLSITLVVVLLNFFIHRRSSGSFVILLFLLSPMQMQKIISTYKSKSKYLGKITSLIHSFFLINCRAFFSKINPIIFCFFCYSSNVGCFLFLKKNALFFCFFLIVFFILKELFGAIHFQLHYFLTKPYSQYCLGHYVDIFLDFIL